MQALITSATNSALFAASFSKEYTDIPNTHAVIDADTNRALKLLYTHLGGTNFEGTSTICVKSNDDGISLLLPRVQVNNEGSIGVSWGDDFLVLDLKAMPKGVSFGLNGNGVLVLEVRKELFSDTCNFIFSDVPIPLAISKQFRQTVPAATMMQSVITQTLGQYLDPVRIRFVKLADVVPGTYVVTSYGSTVFANRDRFYLILDDGRAVSANSALELVLSTRPLIDKSTPAELTIGVSTRQYLGNPVIPARLKLQATDSFSF